MGAGRQSAGIRLRQTGRGSHRRELLRHLRPGALRPGRHVRGGGRGHPAHRLHHGRGRGAGYDARPQLPRPETGATHRSELPRPVDPGRVQSGHHPRGHRHPRQRGRRLAFRHADLRSAVRHEEPQTGRLHLRGHRRRPGQRHEFH